MLRERAPNGHTALTKQTDTPEQWLKKLAKFKAECDRVPLQAAREAHRGWWREFWSRSWLFADGDADARAVTRGYVLQRWSTV